MHNVGDRVRVHTLKWFEQNCNYLSGGAYKSGNNSCLFVKQMKKYCGKTVTIKEITEERYFIKNNNQHWRWDDWMFEEEAVKEETNWEHYQQEIAEFIKTKECENCPAWESCVSHEETSCGFIFANWGMSRYVPDVPDVPQPVYRAWTKDTFPLHVGDEIKIKGDTATWGVVGYDKIREKVVVLAIQHSITFSELFAEYTMADGTPCGELISGEETK